MTIGEVAARIAEIDVRRKLHRGAMERLDTERGELEESLLDMLATEGMSSVRTEQQRTEQCYECAHCELVDHPAHHGPHPPGAVVAGAERAGCGNRRVAAGWCGRPDRRDVPQRHGLGVDARARPLRRRPADLPSGRG